MQINLLQNNAIAHIISDDIVISNEQDAAELLMNCRWKGADSLILSQHNFPAEFFDLSTRLAGNILQKFSTYDGRLAIIGDFSKYASKSLKDFIYESNKARRINFVSSVEEGVSALSDKP